MPSRTLITSGSSGLRLQSAEPQPEQNTFAKPSGGSKEPISSSPETIRSEPGTIRAEADAAAEAAAGKWKLRQVRLSYGRGVTRPP